MRPIKRLQIGKNGLSNEFVEQVRNTFETEQVVKISILKSACRDKLEARAMAEELVDKLGKNYIYRLVGYVMTLRKFRREVR